MSCNRYISRLYGDAGKWRRPQSSTVSVLQLLHITVIRKNIGRDPRTKRGREEPPTSGRGKREKARYVRGGFCIGCCSNPIQSNPIRFDRILCDLKDVVVGLRQLLVQGTWVPNLLEKGVNCMSKLILLGP